MRYLFLFFILFSCERPHRCNCPYRSEMHLVPMYNYQLHMVIPTPMTHRIQVHTEECQRCTLECNRMREEVRLKQKAR